MDRKITIFYLHHDDTLSALVKFLRARGYSRIESMYNPDFLEMKGEQLWITIENDDGNFEPFFDGTLSSVFFGLRNKPVPMFTNKNREVISFV